MRLRARGLARPFVGALLQFGADDLSGQSPSGRLYRDQWFIEAYAGQVGDRTVPDVYPLYGDPLYGDLRDLPPALVSSGPWTSLRGQRGDGPRLTAAGGDVDRRVFPESLHGFTPSPTAMAAVGNGGIASWLDARLAGAEPAGDRPSCRDVVPGRRHRRTLSLRTMCTKRRAW